jgi:hypothetical protein
MPIRRIIVVMVVIIVIATVPIMVIVVVALMVISLAVNEFDLGVRPAMFVNDASGGHREQSQCRQGATAGKFSMPN